MVNAANIAKLNSLAVAVYVLSMCINLLIVAFDKYSFFYIKSHNVQMHADNLQPW